MERTPGSSSPNRIERFDAVPRDGPAVFIVNRAAFDRGELVGGWLPVSDDVEAMTTAVEDIIGDTIESSRRSWIIIDQIDMGGTMIDEDAPLDTLAARDL